MKQVISDDDRPRSNARRRPNGIWLAMPFVLLLVTAIAVAGCGGGGSSSSAQAANEPTAEKGKAETEEATPAESLSTEEGPLGPLSEKLAEHGFRGTAVQPGNGAVEWHISAEPKSGPPTIEISYYEDGSAAQREGKEIEGIYANHAGLVYLNGKLMVQVGTEKKLSPATEEAFEEVEADAEGIE